jgi:hypothetical protein
MILFNVFVAKTADADEALRRQIASHFVIRLHLERKWSHQMASVW